MKRNLVKMIPHHSQHINFCQSLGPLSHLGFTVYGLLSKWEVEMAEYWPGSLFTHFMLGDAVLAETLNCIYRAVFSFHLTLLLTKQIKAVRACCSVICYELFFFREEGNIVSLLPHIFGNLSFHWHFLFFPVFLQVFGSNGNVQCFLIYVKWINFSLVCNI